MESWVALGHGVAHDSATRTRARFRDLTVHCKLPLPAGRPLPKRSRPDFSSASSLSPTKKSFGIPETHAGESVCSKPSFLVLIKKKNCKYLKSKIAI